MSSGPVWTEYLADDLAIASTRNFAFSGATSDARLARGYAYGPDGGRLCESPSLLDQVAAYVAAPDPLPPHATLVVLAVGGNDVFAGGVVAAQTAASFATAVASLARVGYRHFLLVADYSFTSTPWSAAGRMDAAEAERCERFAADLLAALLALAPPPGCRIAVLDLYHLLERIIAAPAHHGFGQIAPDTLRRASAIRAYGPPAPALAHDGPLLWLDEFHATTEGHRLFANEALRVVRDWPAPGEQTRDPGQ